MRLCLPARMGGGGKAESLPWRGPAGEARHTGVTIGVWEREGKALRVPAKRIAAAIRTRTAPLHGAKPPDARKRPVETVVGNGQFRDAGGGTGMTGFGWFSAINHTVTPDLIRGPAFPCCRAGRRMRFMQSGTASAGTPRPCRCRSAPAPAHSSGRSCCAPPPRTTGRDLRANAERGRLHLEA